MDFRSKIAYPNYDESIQFVGPRDTEKWIKITTSLYAEMHAGASKSKAIEKLTSGLDKMEKMDFLNWLKFYEEGAHKKYAKNSIAQSYYMSDDGIYLPSDTSAADDGPVTNGTKPIDKAMSLENDEIQNRSKKQEQEDYKKKILSRLQSLEKLLSEKGKELFEDEYAGFIQALLDLKGRILLLNKKSSSNKIYKDLIIREANKLMSVGYSNSSKFMMKMADTLPPPPAPANPSTMGGLPGVMTTNPVPAAQDSGENEVTEDSAKDGIDGFIEGMNSGALFADDALYEDLGEEPNDVIEFSGPGESEDSVDAEDTEDESFEDEDNSNDGIFHVYEDDENDDDDDYLFTEAQAAPVAEPAPQAPAQQTPAAVPQAKETAEDKELVVNEDSDTDEFESYIDKAFEKLTVKDVVNKLENLIKIFRAREIPRQLSIVDMMLDRLGLSTYFPSLAEATNKSLESNQYVLSRIEDIISRLRGSLESEDVDLSAGVKSEPSDAETLKVKNDLEQKTEKEKQRKKLKKEMEEKAVDEAAEPQEKPEIEVQEDMAGPVTTTTEMPNAAPNQPTAKPVAAPAAPAA